MASISVVGCDRPRIAFVVQVSRSAGHEDVAEYATRTPHLGYQPNVFCHGRGSANSVRAKNSITPCEIRHKCRLVPEGTSRH